MDTFLSPIRCIERHELAGCGCAVIEIVATSLMVKLLVPMSGRSKQFRRSTRSAAGSAEQVHQIVKSSHLFDCTVNPINRATTAARYIRPTNISTLAKARAWAVSVRPLVEATGHTDGPVHRNSSCYRLGSGGGWRGNCGARADPGFDIVEALAKPVWRGNGKSEHEQASAHCRTHLCPVSLEMPIARVASTFSSRGHETVTSRTARTPPECAPRLPTLAAAEASRLGPKRRYHHA